MSASGPCRDPAQRVPRDARPSAEATGSMPPSTRDRVTGVSVLLSREAVTGCPGGSPCALAHRPLPDLPRGSVDLTWLWSSLGGCTVSSGGMRAGRVRSTQAWATPSPPPLLSPSQSAQLRPGLSCR